jgi:endonuclease-3
VAQLEPDQIDRLIQPATFHEGKARQIQFIAQRAVEAFGGELPADLEVLISFPGVGPKCAHLALGVASGQPRISVDIHVHRVTNRWGYVQTRTPEQTLAALEEKLPREWWIEINSLLVPFGKHICMGERPRCSTCPVLEMCRQVGVTRHR